MKNRILIAALAVLFLQGIIVTGCKSSTQKAEDSQQNVQDAREDLQDAKQEANVTEAKAANDQEWQEFKIDADAKIKKNELSISELKTKLKSAGKDMDEAYKQRIDALEKRNEALKSRMNDYETNKGDWESFKREFNHDNDEFGTAMKDVTVDNKR